MFKMRFLLVLYVILAVTTSYVSTRPNKEKDDVYDDGDLLNDEDGGTYTGEEGDGDDDFDEDDDVSPLNISPVIKTQPQIFEAQLGDNVDLPCVTENADAFSILWKKNDVMLYQDKIQVGQRNDHYKRFDNQTLHIESVEGVDEGEYECSVSTSPDLLVVKHKLIVLTPPRIISATANNGMTEVQRGSILELVCLAEGNPPPKISWSKDGSRLKEDNQKFNSNTVTILEVSRDNGGTYVCMADNHIGKPVHQGVHIQVIHSPDMKTEKFIVGKNEMHLICKVHASPKADIFWSKDGIKINKHTDEHIKLEQKHHDNEHILKITDFQVSDFGNYSCSARNKLGHIEKHMLVSGVPTTPKYEKQAYIGENNQILTNWIVSSMTPITALELQFRKKGKGNTWTTEKPNFEAAPGHTYNIEHILKNLEPGVYEARLRSQNMYGWSDFSRPISIEGKPVDISPYTNKNEEPPMPIDDENKAEPAVSSASRTILPWTSILSLIVMKMYSKFI